MKHDIQDVVNSVNMVTIVSKHTTGTPTIKGSEYSFICPFHNDSNPSYSVNIKKQKGACFVCGMGGGNAYNFLRALGHTHGEAMDELLGFEAYNKTVEPISIEKDIYTPVIPIPVTRPAISHFKLGIPDGEWIYRDVNGGDAMYVYRFNTDQGKELRFLTHDGERFQWKCIPDNRPLYNLHLFGKYDNICIVEGEKTADAGNKYIGDHHILFTCWVGGAKAIKRTDWSYLEGKNIIRLPDNDEPGFKAMDDINDLLQKRHISIAKNYLINIPTSYPNKWDIADKEWKQNELYEFIINNIKQ